MKVELNNRELEILTDILIDKQEEILNARNAVSLFPEIMDHMMEGYAEIRRLFQKLNAERTDD